MSLDKVWFKNRKLCVTDKQLEAAGYSELLNQKLKSGSSYAICKFCNFQIGNPIRARSDLELRNILAPPNYSNAWRPPGLSKKVVEDDPWRPFLIRITEFFSQKL